MKTSTKNYVELKKNVENEIKHNVKHIAIYGDNLTKDEVVAIDKYLQIASIKYNIDYYIYGIKNILHNNPEFYRHLSPADNQLGWMAVEIANVTYCDEIWIFDNGYDNYELNGRLDHVLTNFEKPVKFLAQTPDKKSWDFYKGRSVIHTINNELQNDYYIIADEYNDDYNESKDKSETMCKMRPILKEVLSEREYGIVFNALQMVQFMGGLALKATVRNDNILIDKIKSFIKTGNEILIDILEKDSCSDETLQLCEAKLNFSAPEIEKLIYEYQL